MHELISNPGLQFELFELRGTLKYTFTQADKSAKQYVISESDFEGHVGHEDSEIREPQPENQGLNLSAVGLSLRLLKNAGIICMGFEGADGGSAKWRIEGLGSGDRNIAVASAATQTLCDAKVCVTCGRELISQENRGDFGNQSSRSAIENAGTQMYTTREAELDASVAPEIISSMGALVANASTTRSEAWDAYTGYRNVFADLPSTDIANHNGPPFEPTISTSSSIATITEADTRKVLKRKASSDTQAESMHRCAKSKHDSIPWPEHIYMECYEHPRRLGKLIVDLGKATVSFERKVGKPPAQKIELKQLDITSPNTQVVYYQAAVPGFYKAIALLELARISSRGERERLIRLECQSRKLRIWYSTTAHHSKRISITDPEMVVDAIVHCIDRVSKRQAIHDPDRDRALADNLLRLRNAGPEQRLQAELVTAESENRKIAKIRAKVYEPEKRWHDLEPPFWNPSMYFGRTCSLIVKE